MTVLRQRVDKMSLSFVQGIIEYRGLITRTDYAASDGRPLSKQLSGITHWGPRYLCVPGGQA